VTRNNLGGIGLLGYFSCLGSSPAQSRFLSRVIGYRGVKFLFSQHLQQHILSRHVAGLGTQLEFIHALFDILAEPEHLP